MMRFLPHTPGDVASMLEAIGVPDLESLFSTVPADCRIQGRLDLPGRSTEWEMNRRMEALSDAMAVAPEWNSFLGAGSYEHHIPATIPYLLSRSEFLTSYTPYQPEISQGTLQAVYEYQTLVTRLLGMEVANASMYDGASALAEAVLMAVRVTKKHKVALSAAIHPHYRAAVRTYLEPTGFEVVELPYGPDGRTDLSALDGAQDLAAVAVQSPNFFGCIEDLARAAEAVHPAGGLLVACFTEAIAFGLLRSPGSQGADIVCGEGQSLGIPQSFGGPGLGLFAARRAHVRSLPGRLVGQTTDLDGQRGFVLTLSTREQHIRREKATSNICSNNNLCAIAAAMYMATAGPTGMREVARQNHANAEHLKQALKSKGLRIPFESPTFNEFVVEFPPALTGDCQPLLDRRILPGVDLAPHYPELGNARLLCATETKSIDDLEALVREMPI